MNALDEARAFQKRERAKRKAGRMSAPHGFCHQCERALTRIEARDRSHKCAQLERRTADRRISPAIGEFAIQENVRLKALNKELVEAAELLRKEWREHIKIDVKKHYSLLVADVAVSKAIDKAAP